MPAPVTDPLLDRGRHPHVRTLLTVAALTSAGFLATCDSVEPELPEATLLRVAPEAMVLGWIGETAAAAAVVLDQFGNEFPATVSWSSSAPSVATVDAQGSVQATGNGVATVTAAVGALSDQVQVTVDQVPSSIDLSPAPKILTAVGDGLILTARLVDAGGTPIPGASLTWTSDDPDVASVDQEGRVQAVGDGSTLIRVSASGLSAETQVEVDPRPTALVVTPDELTIDALGAVEQLVGLVVDRNGNAIDATVSWSSAGPGIATVSTTGQVTSVANGSTTITASGGGFSEAVEVTVAQVAATLSISPSSGTLTSTTATIVLTAQAADRLGTPMAGVTPQWSSSPSGIVNVSGGIVTPVSNGVATVVASFGGLQATASIEVELPPEWEVLPSMPHPVFAPAVAADGGRIYVIGGEDGGYQQHTQIYDIGTNTWSVGAPAPLALSWASAAALSDGIHLVGGVSSGAAALQTHWIYDPGADAWSVAPPLPAPVAGGTAQVLSGTMVVAGGIDGPGNHSDNVHIFDPATNTWSAGAPVPGERINWSSAVFLGRMFGAGGGTPPGISTGDELLAYDVTSNDWEVLIPLIQEREAHGSGVSDGRFCVFGGRIARSGNFNTPFSSMECYDGALGTWSPSSPLPNARQALGSVTVGSFMYAIGGQGTTTAGTTDFARFRFP